MNDFKFAKFFGITAPMAVLMNPNVFKELIADIRDSVGGSMMVNLKIELEALRYYLVDNTEFVQVTDDTSEAYSDFVKGLQVYLQSKGTEEPTTSTPVTTPVSSTEGTTDIFSQLANNSGNTELAQDAGDAGFEDFGDFGADNGTPIEDFGDFSGDILTDVEDFGDFSGGGFSTMPVTGVPDLVVLGMQHRGIEVQSPAEITPHARMQRFILKLPANFEKYSLTEKEYQEIIKQYGELPAQETGRVTFLARPGTPTEDLQINDYATYHILKRLKDACQEDVLGQRYIDILITTTETAINNAFVETRKLLGLQYQYLMTAQPRTAMQNSINALQVETPKGQLLRVSEYINDCIELLAPEAAERDTNLAKKLKLGANSTLTDVIQALSGTDYLPELADRDERQTMVSFLRICMGAGRLDEVLQSRNTCRTLYRIYKEIAKWDNDYWLQALGFIAVDNEEDIGNSISFGKTSRMAVARDFQVDLLTAKLALDYDIVGVTTFVGPFFSNSLRLISRLDNTQKYRIDRVQDRERFTLVNYMYIHLCSLFRRLSQPTPNFWG